MTRDTRVFSGEGLPIRVCPSFFVLRVHRPPAQVSRPERTRSAQDPQVFGDHADPDLTGEDRTRELAYHEWVIDRLGGHIRKNETAC